MKNFCLLFFLLPSCLLSQKTISYEVSSPYNYIETASEGSSFTSDYSFTNEDKSKSLLIKRHNSHIYFQLFDNTSLKELRQTKYKLYDEIPLSSSISNIGWLGDKLYCFYFRWEKQEWIFKCREIDFDLCRFKGKEIVIFKTDKYPASSWNFPCRITEDRSKIVVFIRQHPKKVRDGQNFDEFSFFLFDKDLKELGRQDIKMPFTEKKMDNIQYLIDNKANMYLLTKVFNDNSRKERTKGGVVNYHYEIYKIDVANGSLDNIKIPVKELITDIALSIGKNEVLYCSGYYTKKYTKNTDNVRILGVPLSQASVDGIFLFKIDKNNEIIAENTHEIPNEIINQYGTKNKEELVNLKFRKLITQEDNSVILVGEQISSSYNGIQFADFITIHFDDSKVKYKDILLTKINAEGNIVWIKRLPKRQIGTQYGYKICADLSFNYQYLKDAHYFIIIDNVKNMSLQMDKKPAEHDSNNGGYLTLYKVDDSSGEITKTSVFNTEELEPGKGIKKRYGLSLYSLRKIIKTSDSSFMLEFYKKYKEDVLVKVNVE